MEARTVDGVVAISDAPDAYTRLIWLRDEEEGAPDGVAIAAALVRRRRGGLMLAVPGGSILESELAASQQEEDHALGPFVRARVRGAGLANPASALATVSFEILLVDVDEGVLTELVPEAVYYEDEQHAQRVLRHFTPRARHWPHGRTVLEESSRAFRSQFGEEAFAEFFTAGEEEAEPAVVVERASEQPAEEEAAEVAGVLGDGFAESDGPLAPPPRRPGRAPALQRPPQPALPRAAPPGGPLARAAAGKVAAAPLLGSGGALAGRSPPTAFGLAAPPAPSAFGRAAPPPGPPSRSGAAGFESPAAWQAVLGRHGGPPGPELRGLRTSAAPAGAFPGTGEDFAGEGEDDAVGGGTEMERFAAALMGAARAFSQRGEEGGAGGNDDLMARRRQHRGRRARHGPPRGAHRGEASLARQLLQVADGDHGRAGPLLAPAPRRRLRSSRAPPVAREDKRVVRVHARQPQHGAGPRPDRVAGGGHRGPPVDESDRRGRGLCRAPADGPGPGQDRRGQARHDVAVPVRARPSRLALREGRAVRSGGATVQLAGEPTLVHCEPRLPAGAGPAGDQEERAAAASGADAGAQSPRGPRAPAARRRRRARPRRRGRGGRRQAAAAPQEAKAGIAGMRASPDREWDTGGAPDGRLLWPGPADPRHHNQQRGEVVAPLSRSGSLLRRLRALRTNFSSYIGASVCAAAQLQQRQLAGASRTAPVFPLPLPPVDGLQGAARREGGYADFDAKVEQLLLVLVCALN
ncbi:unnamed protein product [Prorocentrum cordatum]|uniref:Nudix hydrolase domain-containing protein n=1 Tax=Prorocentrum cordatum TaxID=2364126 RepID=A0ABN9X292_9DINO|nr:unnamed protein product [Polarella glacialis]